MMNFSGRELVTMRLEGRLPIVNIAGNKYSVDIAEGIFRSMNGLYPNLDIEKLYKKGNRFLYRNNGEIVQNIDPASIDFPDDVTIFEIPYLAALDPVGFARAKGINDTTLLNIYPIRLEIDAKIIPWGMTRFTRIIEENNWQRERKKETVSQAKGRKMRSRRKKIK